ncbi:MAG TPA: hypothetical protein VLB76_04975 [Thermoanaerobaculia bacterium]|nr:hypothetical protein [Thermoanaerobaculia bacterium]
MRQLLSSFMLFVLLSLSSAVASTKDGDSSAAAPQEEALVFVEEGYLRVEVVSVKKTGYKVDLTLTYENLTNVDHRMAIYNGGANGKDTMLIDSEGEKWEMLKAYKGGTKGPAGKIFVPSLKVKVPITFVKETGNLDVEKFTLINHVHILASSGATSKPHWTKVTIKDIPSTYSR